MTERQNSKVFLKTIHIQGFKSFVDKIRIDLQPGLSVVVGPNGSGKSNIADAVRWALGEQSAKSLRGNKMEDVIFAGSSTRRPVGMAEVSLVFDNSSGLFALDFQEVVITRRVYRDGESQCFINKVPCRLKDIQELFLDTGSGKEGFSIIGQGRVEEILNLKPEERRLLLEEAAGISKYRLRKKETLKKLEDTGRNLNRLGDIISEVQSRIEPLAKQAEEAAACRELQAELQKTAVTLLAKGISSLNKKLEKSQTELEKLNREFSVLTVELAEEENVNLREKLQLNLLEQQIQDLQGEVYSWENEAKEYQHELSLISERESNNEENLARLEKEIGLVEEGVVLSRQKITRLTDREADLKQALDNIMADQRGLETRLVELKENAGSSRLDDLKNDIFEELTNKSKLGNELVEAELKKAGLQRRIEQMNQEIGRLEMEREALRQTLELQDREETGLEARENVLAGKITETARETDRLSARKRTLAESINVLTRKIDRAAAGLQALRALEENLEGYHRGVKETLLAYRKGEIACGPVYGTVAEIIEVEAKFELAIETALGGALQNILVGSTEDGKKCIAYLKKNNKGRATFLPLDAVRSSRTEVGESPAKHSGFLGLAADLVKCDLRYQEAVNSLLGRILVADNMDSAVEIAKGGQFRWRVVTLQGDQVNPGGSLTGGSFKAQGGGLLSRAREIEELTALLKDSEAELAVLQQQMAQYERMFRELSDSKSTAEKEIKELRDARGILALKKKHNQEKTGGLEESAGMLDCELTEAGSRLNELNRQIETIGVLLENSGRQLQKLQNEQAETETRVKEINVKAEDILQKITYLKVEAAKKEQEISQHTRQIMEEKEKLPGNEELLSAMKEEQDSLRLMKIGFKQNQMAIEASLQENEAKLNLRKYDLVELRREREELSAQILKKEEAIQEKSRRAKELEQRKHQTEIAQTRWQAEWEAGCASLREDYNLGWEEALAYFSPEPVELLQEKIRLLKQQIESLGPVNYASLEEYPEALNRFEFLTAQRNDLIEAGDSLLALVNELDKSMTERFTAGFKAVNEAFMEVFQQLFNGGHAELRLEDPDNLLETGVNIIAQPPGKKAQILSLLSGGERSFTAIALLFAFLRVKPTPFCLLDEIEAALDETNVKRFIEYLKRLGTQTQFIIISHRRGTMESADRLYGITMEESGVSKILSVGLNAEPDSEIA